MELLTSLLATAPELAAEEAGPGAAAAIGSQAAGNSSTLGGLLGLTHPVNNATLAGMGLLTQQPQQHGMLGGGGPPPSQPVQSSAQILGGMYQPTTQGLPMGLNGTTTQIDPRILQMLMGGMR